MVIPPYSLLEFSQKFCHCASQSANQPVSQPPSQQPSQPAVASIVVVDQADCHPVWLTDWQTGRLANWMTGILAD